jgi:hypothetical protein
LSAEALAKADETKSRIQEDPSYGKLPFQVSFRIQNRNGSTTLFDIVKRANHPNRKSYPDWRYVFPRSCLPGVFADDTHIMLGWFVKQAGLF